MSTFKSKPGLIGCGIAHLLFGLLFVAFCGLMVVGLTMAPRGAQAPTPPNVIVYSALLYLALAALFMTLGVGSMLGRRWSRPLILIVDWAWLLTGAASGVMMLVMMPHMFATLPPAQAGAKPFMIGCMAVIFGLFGVIVPAIFIYFYRSPDVKATVETLDPVPRWTDRIPTPLLAFGVWMFMAAVSVAVSSFMYQALPLGGLMLRGLAAKAVVWFFAVALFWIAWGTLRRQRAAWWTAIAMLVIGVVYGVLFMAGGGNYDSWLEAMGMPADPTQVELMRSMYKSPFMYIWMAIIWVAYLGFLLYIRRYFFAPDSERPAIQPTVDLQ